MRTGGTSAWPASRVTGARSVSRSRSPRARGSIDRRDCAENGCDSRTEPAVADAALSDACGPAGDHRLPRAGAAGVDEGLQRFARRASHGAGRSWNTVSSTAERRRVLGIRFSPGGWVGAAVAAGGSSPSRRRTHDRACDTNQGRSDRYGADARRQPVGSRRGSAHRVRRRRAVDRRPLGRRARISR